ncbi:CYFA0S13e03114g1_1 [Cyberlindnera fabianii]|uniref:CYFA0S13e03114g1_1 n=1 Tax=Cyberlindnera fabianii TaxID=36022 RepID=A0A061BAX7_CYBFA|nr:CYFA0S13e03114g1_1 [Cyberlindnera fabianii]
MVAPQEALRGSPASRVASTNSTVSIGTTISTDSPVTTRPSSAAGSNGNRDAYEAVLKVVLLEYKNEPRFKTIYRSPSPQPSARSASPASSLGSRSPALVTSEKASKRHSWFGHSLTSGSELPKDALPKLKKVLQDIAMGSNKSIKDPLTKRSLMRLYNDILKPTSTITKGDELVVRFIGNASKEIQLCGDSYAKTDVYQQANTFISVFLGVLKSCKHSDDSIKKLLEYQKSMTPPTQVPVGHSNQKNGSLNIPRGSSDTQQQSQVRPTYRINEISSAKLIADLFGVDELTLQQDAIKLKDIAQEQVLAADLVALKKKLEKNEAVFNPDDFDTTDTYFFWKKQELNSIEDLLHKLGCPQEPPSSTPRFIPPDTRSTLVELLSRILTFVQSQNSNSLIPNNVQNIIDTCCRYWRINNTSMACLLYQAAHLSILKDPQNELDPDKTEQLFGLMYKRLGADVDHEKWSKPDKKVWITNISNTYIQVMSSLRNALSAIYATKSPKFTPLLRILFEFVETDPFYDILLRNGLQTRWLKRLKNCILSTTEGKYIEILGGIPRDSTLDMLHIKDTAQQIYKHIQMLQKKFPKPLLDVIYIANEAAFLFIKLFSEDVKNMLGHVEHYAAKSGEAISYVDALDTYCELRDLRDIYEQVSTSKAPPLLLEKMFFKYLDELADYTCTRFLPVVKQSLEGESFEPLDLHNGRGFSSSVLDIFKMINETFSLFRQYEWGNDIQIAYIYTKLLKSMSDSLVYYSSRCMRYAIEDLKDEDVSLSKEQAKKNSTWLFNEMRNAISDSKLTAPPPFSFKMRMCVILNNLSQMSKLLNDLEAQIDPEKIKDLVSGVDTYKKQINNVFTIRVVRAENIKPCGSDGFTNSYVVLIDPSRRKEIGKTKTVPKTLNPVYEQEFEIESKSDSPLSITATVWDNNSRMSSHDLCGRALLQLDPKKFRNDGIPEEICRDLDLQGSLVFQVSLESEKDDAIFSVGKAHRSIARTMERIYSMIVEKFSVFINHSFSRQTLKLVCGANGLRKPNAHEANDAIIPLFDYLNSNLKVLAGTLDTDLLINVMLQAWKGVLNSADDLLLPALASVKVLKSLSNNATWKNSLTNAMANVTNSVNIPGFGRALTHAEMECVFIWLNALCEFFHNDGAGPPMELLKEDHYQRLLLIPRHYDENVAELKREVERLTPLVLKAIKAKNFLGDDEEAMKRSNTVARSKTIAAYGTRQRRAETLKTLNHTDSETSLFQIVTEDVLLRVLLAKDQKDFVSRRLTERERIAKSIATERLAKLAVQGRKGR